MYLPGGQGPLNRSTFVIAPGYGMLIARVSGVYAKVAGPGLFPLTMCC